MALFETLVFSLGGALTKAILKLWLPEKSLALAAGEGIVEALTKSGESTATARAVERLFRNLADDMAERLEQIIDSEFRQLPSSDREAAILAVAEVIGSLDLSASMMRANLDAGGLELLARPQAQSTFSKLGERPEALAYLLLRECCAYAVSLALKLPDFQAAATRELLRRQTELLAELQHALDVLAEIQVRARGNDAATGFEIRYRRSITQKLDRMQLFGVDVVSGLAHEIELSVAFVTLTSKRPGSSQNKDVGSSLAGVRRAVVRGEAGSGKTTLLQWMAVRAASRDFPEALASLNALIPFYISLRQFSDGPFPTPEKLVLGIAPNIADMMPPQWAHAALERGALVLIDGIDEVPAARRDKLFDWLRGLVEEFPASTYVVSSRPAALDAPLAGATAAARLTTIGFEQIVLEPMSVGDSEALISKWHRAVARNTTTTEELALLETYERNLIRSIRERPTIRNLASSPLLCSMICLLNWERKQQLPGDRMELYRAALGSLIDRRDADRGIKPALLSELPRTSKEVLLDGIAYWMMQNAHIEADETDVESQIPGLLDRLPPLPDSQATILQELLERSGVLRRPVAGKVDFIHRTFLEFLAARAAVRRNDLGFLAKQADDETWRETIVFAAGHAQGKQRDRLVEKLLPSFLTSFLPRPIEADVTAACCLETVHLDLDQKLLARLRACAEALFPPRSQKDARILAPAAALNPDLLKHHERDGEETVAACVRCASLVGGPSMLEVIEGYADVPGDAVWGELISAWTAFDPDEYLGRVIRRRKSEAFAGFKIEDLDEDTLKCLQFFVWKGLFDKNPEKMAEALANFRKYRFLYIGGYTYGTDLETPEGAKTAGPGYDPKVVTVLDAARLATITSVEALYLQACERGVLTSIMDLPALKTLQVAPLEIAELDQFARAKSLGNLTISGLSIPLKRRQELLDLRPLATVPALKALGVHHFPTAADIILPVGAPLDSLDLAYVPVSTVKQVTLMPGLRKLRVHNDELPDGELLLESLTNLVELNVYATKPVRLKLPASLTKLTLSNSPDVKVANPEVLTSLEYFVLHTVGKFDGASTLLTMPRLRYVNIDDKTREAIGPIPDKWAAAR